MQIFIQLVKKEVNRFMVIWVQTLLGPLSTALLYQLIFGHQLSGIKTGITSINYAHFLLPGLVIMQVLLNAFGNGSSSIIQSKYTGSIIYVLMAPITPFVIYMAYLTSSIIRGVLVGIVVYLAIMWFGDLMMPKSPLVLVFFLIIGASVTGGLGIIAGVLCSKFDQLAGFQSFVMVPLIYLAGVFFNANNFNSFWHYIAMIDPFMYIVDGFRYGFIAHSGYHIVFGSLFVLFIALTINFIGYILIKKGIKIKH